VVLHDQDNLIGVTRDGNTRADGAGFALEQRAGEDVDAAGGAGGAANSLFEAG
jgi:hypothetical protein